MVDWLVGSWLVVWLVGGLVDFLLQVGYVQTEFLAKGAYHFKNLVPLETDSVFTIFMWNSIFQQKWLPSSKTSGSSSGDTTLVSTKFSPVIHEYLSCTLSTLCLITEIPQE